MTQCLLLLEHTEIRDITLIFKQPQNLPFGNTREDILIVGPSMSSKFTPHSHRNDQYLKLDIDNLNIDKNGVRDFFWPVSYAERDVFTQSFRKKYIDIVTNEKNSELCLPYKFLAKYFITEALAVFNSDLLDKRFKEHSITPLYKKEWRLWSSLPEGKIPEDPAFVKTLQRNHQAKIRLQKFNILKKIKRIFSLLHVTGKGIGIGNLKLKSINAEVLEHNIIATQRTQLIQEHAAIVEQEVVFCRSDRWFYRISETELKTAFQKNPFDRRQNNCSSKSMLH